MSNYRYETSLPAYLDIELGNNQLIVLNFIKNRPQGATLEEISEGLGWAINRVCGRRQELELKGLVIASGEYRKTKAGKNAIVWKAVEEYKIENNGQYNLL